MVANSVHLVIKFSFSRSGSLNMSIYYILYCTVFSWFSSIFLIFLVFWPTWRIQKKFIVFLFSHFSYGVWDSFHTIDYDKFVKMSNLLLCRYLNFYPFLGGCFYVYPQFHGCNFQIPPVLPVYLVDSSILMVSHSEKHNGILSPKSLHLVPI